MSRPQLGHIIDVYTCHFQKSRDCTYLLLNYLNFPKPQKVENNFKRAKFALFCSVVTKVPYSSLIFFSNPAKNAEIWP